MLNIISRLDSFTVRDSRLRIRDLPFRKMCKNSQIQPIFFLNSLKFLDLFTLQRWLTA